MFNLLRIKLTKLTKTDQKSATLKRQVRVASVRALGDMAKRGDHFVSSASLQHVVGIWDVQYT